MESFARQDFLQVTLDISVGTVDKAGSKSVDNDSLLVKYVGSETVNIRGRVVIRFTQTASKIPPHMIIN